MRVLGIDPGGAQTGMVVRDIPGGYIAHALLERGDDPLGAFIDTIRRGAARLLSAHGINSLVAIEDLVDPTPQMRGKPIAVRPLLDVAQILGALRGMFPSAVLVRPGGHGATPDVSAYPPHVARQVLENTYPAELIGDREQRGAGQLRHCRSAWDVAGAAARQISQSTPSRRHPA